ncbi:MAG: NapC/NirT family cytochrome c [Alphaproteobacteria bacterium]
MRDNVYAEYTNTIHNQNRTGVRATCSDCHVPREWIHKMVRKVGRPTSFITGPWARSAHPRNSTRNA